MGQTSLSHSTSVVEKVKGWSADVIQLAKIPQSQSHAAYSAFTKGLSSRWIYVLHTIPDIPELLQPLEDAIRLVLIPALTGEAPLMMLNIISLLYLLNRAVLFYATQSVMPTRSLTLRAKSLSLFVTFSSLLFLRLKLIKLYRSLQFDHLKKSYILGISLIFINS